MIGPKLTSSSSPSVSSGDFQLVCRKASCWNASSSCWAVFQVCWRYCYLFPLRACTYWSFYLTAGVWCHERFSRDSSLQFGEHPPPIYEQIYVCLSLRSFELPCSSLLSIRLQSINKLTFVSPCASSNGLVLCYIPHKDVLFVLWFCLPNVLVDNSIFFNLLDWFFRQQSLKGPFSESPLLRNMTSLVHFSLYPILSPQNHRRGQH